MGTDARKIVVFSALAALIVLAGLLVRSPAGSDPGGRRAGGGPEPPAPEPMVSASPVTDDAGEASPTQPRRETLLAVPENPRDTSLLVHVVDRATGEAVRAFSAALVPEGDGRASESLRYGASDEQGEILWRNLRWDRVAILPAPSRDYFAIERGARNERVHEVDLAFTIHGIVVHGRDRPVPAAEVWTFLDNLDHRDQAIAATTDGQGRFVVPVYATGVLWAFARAPGGSASRVVRVIKPERGSDVELRLGVGDETGTIVGDVVGPTGRPIAGANLRVRGGIASLPPQADPAMRNRPESAPLSAPVRTDAQGRFRFVGVSAGEATLRVTAPGWAGTVARVDVVPGGTSNVRVSMTTGARLVGTARTTDGEPLAAVTVVARRQTFAMRSTVTGPDGTYDLRHVQPGANYLEAHHPSLEVTVRDRVEFVEGEELRWDPVFRLGVGGIRGTILTFDGGPFRNGSVRVWDEDGGFRQGRTDAEGRFAIDGLQDRPYEIVVHPPGMVRPVRVADGVRPGDRELDLRMPEVPAPDAYATGQVLDPAGAPITNLRVIGREPTWQSIAVASEASPDGRFRIGPMIAGDWTFSFELQDHPRLIEQAVIGAGETTDLGTLRAAEAVPVEVAVLGAEGSVVALLWGEGLENERVQVESGRVLLPQLAAGEYHLDFFGSSIARKSLGMSLVPGRSARYQVVLEPAVSRVVRVVLPEGQDSSLLRLQTFDGAGRELATWRLTWYTSWGTRAIPFRPQAVRLVVTGEDGARGEARLESDEVLIVLR